MGLGLLVLSGITAFVLTVIHCVVKVSMAPSYPSIEEERRYEEWLKQQPDLFTCTEEPDCPGCKEYPADHRMQRRMKLLEQRDALLEEREALRRRRALRAQE